MTARAAMATTTVVTAWGSGHKGYYDDSSDGKGSGRKGDCDGSDKSKTGDACGYDSVCDGSDKSRTGGKCDSDCDGSDDSQGGSSTGRSESDRGASAALFFSF